MSFAVLRGSPKDSQKYLDRVIDDTIQNGVSQAKSREEVNLAEILYYCMKTNPDAIHMINGVTGEKFTNERILKRAISIARAVAATCATETVIIMVRNHEHMSALYYAVLLAGVVPFMMEPGSTPYELQHFLSLVNPGLVFCEPDRQDDVTNAVQNCDVIPDVVAVDKLSLDKFVEGHSNDIESFRLPARQPESAVLMLPTSGSTGISKAAIMSHQGLVAQLPSTWLYHSQFPKPSRLTLLLSTAQWMTHTIIMTSCPVYQVPILMSPMKMSAEYISELASSYRPSWAFAGPALAAALGHTSTEKLSFDILGIGGSPFSPDSMAPLKKKLSPSSLLLNLYGMTETQGFVTMGTDDTPLTSVGKIVNILDYKIVNEHGGDILEPYEKGELYLKGKCILKGYLKNEAAYRETVTSDGWLKTGDIFYRNEEDQLFFANRTKLGFKYLNHHIYPEEVERVIGSLPGVQQCVVCGTDAGPTAAVVVHPGCDVSREKIQQVVNSKLSDYKRLRGGIAFVPSLPRTSTGKIQRNSCLQIVQELVAKGKCF